MSKYSIKRAAIILVIVTIIEKILGFVREMVIASQFGASGYTDAYIGGYLIPNFIMVLLSYGLVNVYTPVFMSEKESDEVGAWKRINSISTYTMMLIFLFTILGIVFSREIVSTLYPGFNENSLNIAVDMSRLFFIGIFVYSGSIIEGSLLNCYRHFVYQHASIGLLSLGTIIFVVLFGKRMGINTIAYGYLAGAGASLIIQYIKLKSINKNFGLNFKIYPDFMRKFFELLFPVLVATSMSQVNVFVDRIFASYLPEGSMSYLSYGNKVVELPIMLFSGIIATIIFPDLIDYINKKDNENLKLYFNKAIIISLIFLIPSFVGLATLNQDVVRLLYERNVFNRADTINTASALFYYSPTIILYGGTAVVSKVYYSMKDTVTLMYISIFTIVLNAVFDYLLMKPMGHNGLALATSIVAVFQFGVAYLLLKRKLNISMGAYLLKNLFKISIASTGMAIVLYVIKTYSAINSIVIFVGLSILSGAAVYFVILLMLKIEELNLIIDKLKKRKGQTITK